MMRKWIDRILFVVALVVALIAVLVVGGLLWLRTPWGHDFVRGQIVGRLGGAMAGQVELGHVRGDILHGVTLIDFALVGDDGVRLIAADTVQVGYGLRPFFRQQIVIERVRFVRPEINLVRAQDGRWNFQTIWKPRPPRPPDARPGWGSFVEISSIEFVDGAFDVGFEEGGWGRIDWAGNRFVGLNGAVGLALHSRDENLKRFEARDLSFRATAPALVVRRLDGTGVLTPDSLALREIDLETAGSRVRVNGLLVTGDPAEPDSFALAIRAPRVDLDEVKRFFPEVRLDGVARYEGRLVGPAGNPSLVIDRGAVDTGRSEVAVEGILASLGSGLHLDLAAEVSPLDPADVRLFVPAYPIAQPVSGAIAVDGPPSTLDVEAELSSRSGAFALEGTIDSGSSTIGYDLIAESRSLDIGGLLGQPQADLVLTGVYRIEGRGTGPTDLDARVSATLQRSRVFRWDVMALETHGRLLGRTYAADTLWARLPQTVLQGEGSFGLARHGTMDAAIALESEDLGDLWPTLSRLGGRGRVAAQLSGTYADFDVVGDVAAADVELQAVRADSFVGGVRMTDVGAAMRLEAQGTVHGLTASTVRADTAAVDLVYAAGIVNISSTMSHPGDEVTTAAGTIDLRGAQASFTLDRFEHRAPDEVWSMAEGSQLTIAGGEIVAHDFRLTQNGQTLRADGVFSLSGSSDLTFAAENIDLREVAQHIGQPEGDWQGRATLRGRLRGTRLNPMIEVEGELSEGKIRGFSFVRVDGNLVYDDRTGNIDMTITTPEEGHEIVVTGQVPFDLALMGGVDRLPDRPIDVSIRGVNTDMSLLGAFVPGISDLTGPVDIRVDIRGTTEAPRFDGAATIQSGRLTINATGVTYEDIVGQIAFSNDRITVEQITGTDGDDGRFQIDGGIAMENLQFGELDLEMLATELIVVDLTRRFVQVNGNLTLTGTTDLPVIEGQIIVDEAIYRLPEQRGKDIINLDQAVIYVQIPGEEAEPDVERSPSPWDRTRMDLVVVVTDDAVLTASNARIEIAGDLSLLKPAGVETPSFSGTLQVRRGYYEEFGRRFIIEGGELFFYGTPEINPGLHVVATRTVPDVEGVGDVNVRIVVGGRMRSPTIDLESTPPFDKSEIISIALFGSPRTSASQQGQLTETVEGLVLGAASGELTRALSEELNLDLLEFQQFQDEGGEQAQLVRIGKLISPDVYVTFEQQFGGLEQESAVGLRYQMTEIFTLQATAGRQRERFAGGLDLFWEFTY
jgi:autotransporter translocation and assembly factor TamB